MLNTTKLLYILPDVAYLAELVPGKKPIDFSIQNFRQINGNFFARRELIQTSLKKLFTKLDEGEYHLILPDFIFTNTMIKVKESSESKVKEHLKEKVLPDLKINQTSHQIENFILTELKGVFQIQLSALAKDVLEPIRQTINSKIKIKQISGLSWTLKSVVSLEPSLTLLQMGSNLFLAKHYIGLDQPVIAQVEETEKIVETVKTLKGSDSSLQTLYLLTNSVVEDKLKQNLEDILPLQQLADKDSAQNKIPSYVSQAIKASMSTISIDDFEIPEFVLGKSTEANQVSKKANSDDSQVKTSLPQPTEVTQSAKTEEKVAAQAKKNEKEKVEQVEDLDDDLDDDLDEDTKSVIKQDLAQKLESEQKSEKKIKPQNPQVEPEETIDLNQFVDHEAKEKNKVTQKTTTSKKTMSAKPAVTASPVKKQVIKNEDGVDSLIKMFFIGLASFSITVAIGIGIGLGVLKLSSSDSQQVASPVVEVPADVAPTLEPSPSPTPLPEIDRAEFSIKVVNATTKAGYAGEYQAELQEAGYKEVAAKNAQGDYEAGFYLLMAQENQALLKAVEADTDLELEFSSEVKTEDPKAGYDAVLVLAE